MAPFYGWGSTSQGYRATKRRQFTCHHYAPRSTWYSFHKPRKDERRSRPWSYWVVLNTRLLNWESSVLITRQLLQLQIQRFSVQTLIICLAMHLDSTIFQDSQGPFQWLKSIKQDCLPTYEVEQGWPWGSQVFPWKLSEYKALSIHQVSRSNFFFTRY